LISIEITGGLNIKRENKVWHGLTFLVMIMMIN
jgi:hypothetical protein